MAKMLYILIVAILLNVGMVSAWTPPGNIDMRDYYNITDKFVLKSKTALVLEMLFLNGI